MLRTTTLRPWALLALIVSATAQTPPHYPPSTDRSLTVLYSHNDNGSLVPITPNELVPENLTTAEPTIALPHSRATERGKFMVLMLDVSLSLCNAPALATSSDAPGLQANRTTYLHWFQGNLTRGGDRALEVCTGARDYTIAPYVAPSANPGDIPHTYAFYLLRQPEGYVLPEEDWGKDLVAWNSTDRIGFDVRTIADVVGGVLAGTYLREQGGEGTFC